MCTCNKESWQRSGAHLPAGPSAVVLFSLTRANREAGWLLVLCVASPGSSKGGNTGLWASAWLAVSPQHRGGELGKVAEGEFRSVELCRELLLSHSPETERLSLHKSRPLGKWPHPSDFHPGCILRD